MGRSSNGRGRARKEPVKESAQREGRSPKGALIVIGGREDKRGERRILRVLAERIGQGKLVVATLASSFADECWQEYQLVFAALGVKRIEHLGIERRDDLAEDPRLQILKGAAGVFFTGGDQLQITGKLGGTRLYARIEEIFKRGGIIAGTSAGAAAMGGTMLVGGKSEGFYKVGDVFQMSPGLGLVKDLIIDQHFSERGRIRRLLGAVAQNPRMLGVGIDEDTAIVVEGERSFEVIGAGAVYVVDGRDLTYTNISEASLSRAMSVFGVKLHILSQGDSFDLKAHQPVSLSNEVAGRKSRLKKT
jgi:cyanophycinase